MVFLKQQTWCPGIEAEKVHYNSAVSWVLLSGYDENAEMQVESKVLMGQLFGWSVIRLRVEEEREESPIQYFLAGELWASC